MNKLKSITKIILVTLILILGMFIIESNNAYAEVRSSDGYSTIELFSEDKSTFFSSSGIPTKLLDNMGWSVWCVQKGTGLSKYMTAPQTIYEAYYATADNLYSGSYEAGTYAAGSTSYNSGNVDALTGSSYTTISSSKLYKHYFRSFTIDDGYRI